MFQALYPMEFDRQVLHQSVQQVLVYPCKPYAIRLLLLPMCELRLNQSHANAHSQQEHIRIQCVLDLHDRYRLRFLLRQYLQLLGIHRQEHLHPCQPFDQQYVAHNEPKLYHDHPIDGLGLFVSWH